MAEEIDFENRRPSNFHVTLTLTLDRAIWHTVVHHSSTSTYTPNFIRIGETFCGRTDGRKYGLYARSYVRTDGQTSRPALFRSTGRSRPNNGNRNKMQQTLSNPFYVLRTCFKYILRFYPIVRTKIIFRVQFQKIVISVLLWLVEYSLQRRFE